MGITWVPRRANGSTDLCAGLAAYEQGRPEPSTAYEVISWIFLGIALLLQMFGILAKVHYRNDPRFRVVRPIHLSGLSFFYSSSLSIALMVNLAVPQRLPCAVYVIFIFLGIGGLGVGYILRLLNYVIQSKYEIEASKYRMRTANSASNQQEEQFATNDEPYTSGARGTSVTPTPPLDNFDPEAIEDMVPPNSPNPETQVNEAHRETVDQSWQSPAVAIKANSGQFPSAAIGGSTDPPIASAPLSSSAQSVPSTRRLWIWQALASLFQVVFACKNLDEVSFEELVLVKRARIALVFTALFPCLLMTVLLLIIVQQYWFCFGCSWFGEMVLAFMVALSPYILLGGRLLHICKKEKFPDRQGIFFESILILITNVPLDLGWLLLMLLDPGGAEYNRYFAYEWLFLVALLLFWWFTTGFQVLRAYQQRRELNEARHWWYTHQLNQLRATHRVTVSATTVPNSHGTPNPKLILSFWPGRHPSLASTSSTSTLAILEDFLDQMDHNDSLKEDFTKFAISRYAVENLHFVNDARTFKRFFEEKAPSWRRQKALFLYDTYIRPNSPMEVNISDCTRKAITAEIQNNLSRRSLENAFELAVQDISCNILRQIWVEFQHERQEQKRRRESSSPRSNGRGIRS